MSPEGLRATMRHLPIALPPTPVRAVAKGVRVVRGTSWDPFVRWPSSPPVQKVREAAAVDELRRRGTHFSDHVDRPEHSEDGPPGGKCVDQAVPACYYSRFGTRPPAVSPTKTIERQCAMGRPTAGADASETALLGLHAGGTCEVLPVCSW